VLDVANPAIGQSRFVQPSAPGPTALDVVAEMIGSIVITNPSVRTVSSEAT